MSQTTLGLLRGIGVAALIGILGYLGDASHLNGVLSYGLASIVSALCLAMEHNIADNTGKALFGAVRV